jgi:hypothetical protein
VFSSVLSVYGDAQSNIFNQVDLTTYFINSLNMILFTISTSLFYYIWFVDRHTWERCVHQAPRDMNFLSSTCDTLASFAYLGFILYGTIMRLLIAGDALQEQDPSRYLKHVKPLQAREYNMYVIGDAIYLISPIALWMDYVALKHKNIVKEDERKQKLKSDRYEEHNDDLRQALLAESQDERNKRNYGANDDVMSEDPMLTEDSNEQQQQQQTGQQHQQDESTRHDHEHEHHDDTDHNAHNNHSDNENGEQHYPNGRHTNNNIRSMQKA